MHPGQFACNEALIYSKQLSSDDERIGVALHFYGHLIGYRFIKIENSSHDVPKVQVRHFIELKSPNMITLLRLEACMLCDFLRCNNVPLVLGCSYLCFFRLLSDIRYALMCAKVSYKSFTFD